MTDDTVWQASYMQEVADTTREPIIFKLAGHPKPDMRIKAFNAEFHVHSSILKLYSVFFRKCLDSPEKTTDLYKLDSAEFAFEYETVVDDDGSWSVMAVNSPARTSTWEKYPGDAWEVYMEERAFEVLLKAMYLEPYSIGSPKELIRLTTMADYYCALRVVSRTLDSALLGDEKIWTDDPDKASLELLPIAAKLRNARLFRQCIVWICSKRHDSDYACDVEDKKLSKIIRNASNDVMAKYGTAMRTLMQWDRFHLKSEPEKRDRSQTLEEVLALADEAAGEMDYCNNYDGLDYKASGRTCWPVVFRILEQSLIVDRNGWFSIYTLLDNNLYFNGRNCISGVSDFLGSQNRFFCAEIDDDDLPWSQTEEDW